MASFLVVGVGVSAMAISARAGIRAWARYQAIPKSKRPFAVNKKFALGGFEPKMSRTEAAKILGVRKSASVKKIKGAHRTLMVKAHPDRGGSPYLAEKVNAAKDLLTSDMFT